MSEPDGSTAELSDDDVSDLKELAEWWRSSKVGRRAVIGASAAGIGAALTGGYGAGTAAAQPTGDEGQVGTQNDRVEAWVSEMDAASVDTEQLSSIKFAGANDDLQSIIDENTRRRSTVFCHSEDGAEWTMDSTILFGEMTYLFGEFDTFGKATGYDYQARPELNWPSSVTTAMKTDPNASYRSQRPRLKNMTLVGAGYGNGQTGFLLEGSTQFVGLSEFKNVTFGGFDYCLDGGGATASGGMYVERCQFEDTEFGIRRVGKKASIGPRNVFWRMKGTGGACISIAGNKSAVFDNQLEPNNSDCIGIFSGGITQDATIQFNQLELPAASFIVWRGSGASIMGNTTDGEHSDHVFKLEGNTAKVIGNVVNNTTANSSVDVFRVSGNHNYIAGNTVQPGYNNTLYIESGAADNIYYGPALDGITDNGTRTLINGWGTNSGDPNSTGEWNGNGREGVMVRDTTNGNNYAYVNGGWVGL